ncbi:MFS transporter [Actinokineospora pegani]|uniref:MFS transporter n=1 Tax=Actinokineospora pegani TaxID=2654637 RepID=UPI0012EA53BF|nr:MFS transporter [Actinokineospora pegani]
MQKTTTPHRLPARQLAAASSGNALEWFDWTIYATFSVYFATEFFPKGNDALALINTFATYALAFFFRPLGGVLLGRFADTRGRKPAMLLTIVLMAAGSIIIAVLPTFEQVGWLSPILLLLARVGQGLSLGGEASSTSVYLAEIAPADRRGRYSSFFYISTGSAVLVATVLGSVLSGVLDDAAMASWGWRVPFLMGGVIGLIGLWLRRAMPETELFHENKTAAQRVRNPLRVTLREHPRAVGQLLGFSMLSTLCYYTFFSALTPFAVSTRKADPEVVFLALSIATAVFIALQYPMGWAADRFGRKPQLLVWSGLTAVLIFPLSLLVTPALGNLVLVFTVGLALYTAMTSVAPALMSELFPTRLRALGIGAWYNLTVAVFGGTAPLLISALSEAGLPNVFFLYVTGAAVVAFLVILTLPETKGAELE